MINFFTKHLLVRYFISGGTSAFVNLALLSLFHYIFDIYYIFASILAFIIAFFVSLFLQKFWTFKDSSTENIHLQTWKYLVLSLFGLVVNTILLYIFVDIFHFYVFLGQIFAGIIVACLTFFISRDYVFKYSKIS